ncbi:MAG TPA: DUF11 domain-containing protein [Chloroflexota bacterium]|nr:DUF11 domain-containing protein [Chloroflexota bacterium]
MYRQTPWQSALLALLALALLTPLSGLLAGGEAYAAVPAAPAPAPAADAPAAVPSHHFGFSRASLLAQATSQGISFGGGLGASPNANVQVGSQVTKTIPITNISGGTETNVTITDVLPFGTTFVSATSTQGSCATPTVGATGTVTCTIGTLAPYVTATVTIVLIPTASAPQTVTDPITVAGTLSNGVAFSNATNILFTVSTVPPVSIQKYVSAVNGVPTAGYGYGLGTTTNVSPGDRVTFSVLVSGGSGTITVTDFLGPNYTFVSASPSICAQATTPVTPPSGVPASATAFNCTLPVTYGYPGYGSPSFTFDATVNASTPFGTDANANTACILQGAPYGGYPLAGTPCATASLNVTRAPTPTPTPSLRNVITAVNGSPPSPSNTNATVPAGSTVAFQVTANVPPPAGYGVYPYGTPPTTYPATITDFLSPNFTVNLSDVSGASCVIVATPANRPAGVAADATTLDCTPTVSAGTATIGLVAHLKSDAPAGADTMANVACFGGTSPYGTGYGAASYTSCATVQATITGATAPPNGSLTLQQAIAQTPASGQGGPPCAVLPGTACTASGQTSGSGVVAASMRWTLTATVPAGVAAGTLPFAVFSTTVGQEGFACAPVVAGGTTVSCTGVTAGNALQGSTVTVVFGPGLTAVGNITAAVPGQVGAPSTVPPLLPPVPPAPVGPAPLPAAALPLAPPPLAPPALLPPPPARPVGAAPGMAPGAAPVYPDVPVIPEADTLVLLAVGLAGLTARAALRRRPPHA